MTVAQFCNLSIEETDKVRIWNCEKQANVFEGTYREAKDSAYKDLIVCSFNIEDGMVCVNV